MAHSVFTIVADVEPARLPRLIPLLREIQAVDGNHHLLPFKQLDTLHFASFVIFDESPPLLVFEHAVDGPIGKYLRVLIERCGDGIDAVYENCVGYERSLTPEGKLRYLRKRVHRPQLYHIGSAYRSVDSIAKDADLRTRLERRVDELLDPGVRAQLRPPPPPMVAPQAASRRGRHATLAIAAITSSVLVWLVAQLLWAGQLAAAILSSTLLVFASGLANSYFRQASQDAQPQPATGSDAGSPIAIWRKLKDEFRSVARRPREPRLLERLKNWLLAFLVPVAVVSMLINLVWDQPAQLFAATTIAFSLEGVFLAVLFGWPAPGGTWKTALRILLPAVGVGAFLGLWPWKPAAALWSGVLLLLPLFVGALARLLSAGEARESRGNWRIVPFALLALGASGALLIGLGAGRWRVMIVGAIAFWLAFIAIAALAFVALVFVSTMRRLPDEITQATVAIGSILALDFYLATRFQPGGAWSWVPIGFYALVLLAGAVAVWSLELPSPGADHARPSNEHLRILTAQEDVDVQNHMSVMVHLRSDIPGRSLVLRSFFHALNRGAYRTLLPDLLSSSLFGISTVHFAHWTVLDARRHIFLSNYDFSWAAYLDDFGFKLGKGLQMIWGQSEGCPGTARLESFKEFAREKAVPYQVWYRAYPHLTSLQILNNEELRLGLIADADEKTSLRLLRRLAGLEKA
jgi:hypothetical protein